MATPPIPSPGPQSAICYVEQKRSPTENELTVWALGLPALRRVRVCMRVSNKRNQVELPSPWWVSARATCKYPLTDLAPVGNLKEGGYTDIWAAPSMVYVPPLGGPLMATFLLYIPDEPRIASVTLKFNAELDAPQTETVVWGYPDSTPHPYDGLLLTPVGNSPVLQRAPNDNAPELATELELKRRL
jgi:hypothetical protein